MRSRLHGRRALTGLVALVLVATPVAADPPLESVLEPRLVDAVPVGPSVAERLADIQTRIQRALVYPPLARRRGLEGVALLRFEIRHDGEPAGLRVARSSGHYVLDRAAEHSVRRAAPLPWVYGRIEVPVRFALASRR